MAEQKKKETRPTKPSEGGGEGGSANPEVAKKGKKIKEDIDKLLDEIDDILEENAEEFVKSYVQRGGEQSMPIYEYRCGGCSKEFERYVASAGGAATCPACGSGS